VRVEGGAMRRRFGRFGNLFYSKTAQGTAAERVRMVET
jgi:hypothetical protein